MPATLLVTYGETPKKRYPLDPSRSYLFGRAGECDIVIYNDTKVSRRHCVLKADRDGNWVLTDQGSSNGTVVNHHPIVAHPLRDGDVIRVGRATFEFRT